MVEPYEPTAMADAFELLAFDDALRERMGRACIDDARAHELASAIDGLERTYEELLASRRHRARE
jgi:glycosyltransferase involved in cell wall biosynthesis